MQLIAISFNEVAKVPDETLDALADQFRAEGGHFAKGITFETFVHIWLSDRKDVWTRWG